MFFRFCFLFFPFSVFPFLYSTYMHVCMRTYVYIFVCFIARGGWQDRGGQVQFVQGHLSCGGVDRRRDLDRWRQHRRYCSRQA